MTGQRLSVHLCVFFVSLSMLILEISWTRVLSVAQWYHFAFLVISIALFGMGAAGTFLSVYPGMLEEELAGRLRTLTFAYSLSIVASFWMANNIPFDPFRMTWERMQLLYLLVYYLLLSIPFFFSGVVLTLALAKMEDVGRVYFSSLVGAGMGSLLAVILAPLGAKTIGISAFLAAVALVGHGDRRRLPAAWLGLLLLLAISTPQINISPYKSLPMALSYPGSELLYTEWNAYSRIDLFKSPMARYAPGLSYVYRGEIPEQFGITVDGDQLTALTLWHGNLSSLAFTGYLPASLPFHLSQGRTLILDAGGGLDVLTALYHNVTAITAVEPNPIVVDILKKYGEFPETVALETGEGRSYVRRSRDRYEVILLTPTESGPGSTGIYALSENYAYTVEAFQEYYGHLSENGILSITRWLLPPPREGVRVVSLAVAALENEGVERPERHIAAIRSWGTITILVKRSEFTPGEMVAIREFGRERRFDLVYLPGIAPEEANIYNRFPEPLYYQEIDLLFADRDRFYKDYLFDVSPVTDERPFFFHFFKLEKIAPTYRSMGGKWQPFLEGAYLLPVIFLQALILSLVFILLPLRRLGRYGGKMGILTYFLCIGLGFIFVEITLIQKFILFLGYPIYAVSAVLLSLLLSAGVGSFYSERTRNLRPIVIALSLLIILYLPLLPEVFGLFLGSGLTARYLISLAAIAPLGFLMGMPFPLGLRLAKGIGMGMVPWAWAVNGCASVLGSILVIMIALSYGFNSALILASAAYLAGMAALTSSRPPR